MTKFNFMDGKEIRKQVLAMTMTLVVLFSSLSVSIVIAKDRNITIIDKNKVYTVAVADMSVSELFKQENIKLNAKDTVNVNLSESLKSVYEIIIQRANAVEVSVDGFTAPLHTQARTVSEALAECNITLGQYDSVSPSGDAAVADGTNIVVTRRNVTTETVTEAVSYGAVSKNTSSLQKGVKKVTTKGQNGTKALTYEVTYENGAEASRTLVSEVVTKAPVAEVTLVGTATKSNGVSLASIQGSKPFSYKKALSFRATAYDPSAGTITASGRRAQVGVVAVDTSVIPLGTRLYIESADGGKSWVYGYCVAGDTGGAIKNNRVDLFYNTASEARAFGVRNATVYVLD